MLFIIIVISFLEYHNMFCIVIMIFYLLCRDMFFIVIIVLFRIAVCPLLSLYYFLYYRNVFLVILTFLLYIARCPCHYNSFFIIARCSLLSSQYCLFVLPAINLFRDGFNSLIYLPSALLTSSLSLQGHFSIRSVKKFSTPCSINAL